MLTLLDFSLTKQAGSIPPPTPPSEPLAIDMEDGENIAMESATVIDMEG